MKPANDMMPEILRSRDHDIAVLMKALAEERAEIERLRAALGKIADLVESEAGEPLDDAISIARKALAVEQTLSPVDRGNQVLREQRDMPQEPAEDTIRRQRDEWERS